MHCVGVRTCIRLPDLTAEELDANWQLDLRSVVLTLREAAGRVQGGRVVALSPAVTDGALVRQSCCTTAEAGLEAAVRVAASSDRSI